MPGDFGELTVNIGLGINFLAGGTLYLNSNDTLSYVSDINEINSSYFQLVVDAKNMRSIRLGEKQKVHIKELLNLPN